MTADLDPRDLDAEERSQLAIDADNEEREPAEIKPNGRKVNLLGRRVGRLVVTGPAPSRRTPSGQAKTYWTCQCDCGNRSEVLAQNLVRGGVKSCGCLNEDLPQRQAKDLTGQRHGRLLVIERAENKGSRVQWLCRCDCGTEKVIPANMVMRYLSCGCLRDYMSAVRRWTGDDVGYLAMHERVKKARGSAKSHSCIDCGARAREWSYDGHDVGERWENVNGYTLAFSTSTDHYEPRCTKCHRRYDISIRKERAS